MDNKVKHKVGDTVYFFFNDKESRRCVISAIQVMYGELYDKKIEGKQYVTGHIHYQLRKHHWDFIDDEIFDPGLSNLPRTDNWIPIEMIYSEKDFFERKKKEEEIQACSENSCELVSNFLNDEETHNEEFFKKELVTLNKELRKQKALLRSIKMLIKQYNYLDDVLRMTNINILSRITELMVQIKDTNNELHNGSSKKSIINRI